MMVRAAVVQLTSTSSPQHSLEEAESLVRKARLDKAELIVLPENVPFMGQDQEKLQHAEALEGPFNHRFSALAAELNIWLLAGTFAEQASGDLKDKKTSNTSILFDPQGRRVKVYRKIHLFDINVGEGARFQESKSVIPGNEVTVAETPWGGLGMSVCYDLRFPELYREHRSLGATFLAVPAAFTVVTGRDHWEVLLRARAIENQCFVLAAAQSGQNTPERETYGRSMIIHPWGTVLATCADGPGVAIADLDLDALHSLRNKMPCFEHAKLLSLKQ